MYEAVFDGVIEVDALFASGVDDFHHHVVWQRGREVCGVVGLAVHHGYRQFIRVAEVGHLLAPCEAAVTACDVDDICRLLGYERVKVADVIKVFAGCDGSFDVPRDLPEAVEVPTSCRFFGPSDVEVLFDALDADDGFFRGPVFVAVDEQAGAVRWRC